MSFPGATDRPAGAASPLSGFWDRGGKRLTLAALTIVAVGLAWGGQAVTTRSLPDYLSALDLLDRLFPAYSNRRELSAALILLCGGALLLGIISWRWGSIASDGDEPLLPPVRSFRPIASRPLVVWLGAAAGVGLWAIFLAQLYRGKYEHWVNLLLLLALLLIALPFALRDNGGKWSWPRPRFDVAFGLQALFVVCVAGGFMYLNARDLGSWKYSAVGDEYNNFYKSLDIAKGAFFNPWSHRGADDLAGVMANAGQALFMKIGNEDNFAWRFYGVFITAMALIPFYLLLRELLTVRIAVLGTILCASSHYLFGYAHHVGYLDSLLPTSLGLWLLVVGLKRDSMLALFGSGMALAMGFYCFESGRAAVAIVALFMLTFGPRAFRPQVFVPLAGGFILLVLPLFATDGVRHVFDQMFSQSAIDYSSAVTGDRLDRFQMNVQLSFVSFNFSNAGRHYVWGSLADPVTAALFVLGLGVALFRIKRAAYRLLIIWYVVEVAFGGFSNPYPMVPISRMQAAVMPVAALAALAVDAIIAPIVSSSPLRRFLSNQRWDLAVGAVVVTLLGAFVLYLNLNRFWYQMPRRFGAPSNEAVVIRASRYPQCDDQPLLVIARKQEQLLFFNRAFASYRREPAPLVLVYPDALTTLSSATRQSLGNPVCVIPEFADTREESAAAFAALAKIFPDLVRTTETDLSGYHLEPLLSPPPAAQ